MSNRELDLAVRAALIDIVNGDRNSCEGLCQNVYRAIVNDQRFQNIFDGKVINVITEYAKSWPKHSGMDYYPVPAPDSEIWAMCIYDQCSDYYKGQYGQDRLELAQYIIDAIADKYGLEVES